MALPILSIAGLVAYDGTAFHGFQIQRNAPTIQAALEDALKRCTGSHVRITGSGRTDSGVHANGQVIAANVPWKHSLENLQKAWNASLPQSIAIRNLVLAPTAFHPRFSADKRCYRYTVYDCGNLVCGFNSSVIPRSLPLIDRFSLYVRYPLDLSAMQRASTILLGQHDFATFGQPPQGENTVRIVEEATWQVICTNLTPLAESPIRQLAFTVTANAFLRRMVRNFVGTLLAVGKGQWLPEDVADALAACDRKYSAPPAPPQGLILESVTYPESVNPWHPHH